MYIEFKLSSDLVRTKLNAWAVKYNIKYRTKVFKYTLRVTFDSDESYTLFAMTWVPHPDHPEWTTYCLVTDLNNKI
jgi:hypothetical protein